MYAFVFAITWPLCTHIHTLPFQAGSISLIHVFSVEKDDVKRELLMQEHDDVLHVFADVRVMSEKKGYCYKCNLDAFFTVEISMCKLTSFYMEL